MSFICFKQRYTLLCIKESRGQYESDASSQGTRRPSFGQPFTHSNAYIYKGCPTRRQKSALIVSWPPSRCSVCLLLHGILSLDVPTSASTATKRPYRPVRKSRSRPSREAVTMNKQKQPLQATAKQRKAADESDVSSC